MRKIFLCASLFLFPFTSNIAQTQTVGLFTAIPDSYNDGYVLFPPYQNCDTTFLINRCVASSFTNGQVRIHPELMLTCFRMAAC